MKTATYRDTKGKEFKVDYDETAPCIVCGLPVIDASMGGTNVCPACDCGNYRNGEPHGFDNKAKIREKAKRIEEIRVLLQQNYPKKLDDLGDSPLPFIQALCGAVDKSLAEHRDGKKSD